MSLAIKVDFFQAEIPEGLPRVEEILNEIDELEGEARAYDLDGATSAWLLQLKTHNSKLEGNFVRGRSNYLPKKGRRGEETKGLNVENDEEVTDESAFIFDPLSNVLALQRNRSGLSRRGVEVYLSGHRGFAEPILFKPLVKQAALVRLSKMTRPKKLVMKIAKPENSGRYVAKDVSTNEAIRMLNKLNSPVLRIEASVGRTNGTLAYAKEFARELLGLNDDDVVDVKSLQVTGEINDEPAFVDLIEDKIISVVPVVASDRRTLPFGNRRTSLRVAWEEQLEELRAYGVKS